MTIVTRLNALELAYCLEQNERKKSKLITDNNVVYCVSRTDFYT